jgi:hypothetical protein
MHTSAFRTLRCPSCGAAPGAACRDKHNNPLPGIHFKRSTAGRRSFRLAMAMYAPLGFVEKPSARLQRSERKTS